MSLIAKKHLMTILLSGSMIICADEELVEYNKKQEPEISTKLVDNDADQCVAVQKSTKYE